MRLASASGLVLAILALPSSASAALQISSPSLGTLLSDAATIDNLKRQAKGLRGLAATWRRNPTGEL